MLPENMCRTIGRRRVKFSSPQRNGQPQEVVRPGLLSVNNQRDLFCSENMEAGNTGD